MMNKCVAILCAFSIVTTPMAAYADDTLPPPPMTDLSMMSLGKVSQLDQNQRAPFSGVLLSDEAAARLFGEIKFNESECQLRLARELSINTLQLSSQIDALKLQLDVEVSRTESLLSVKNERIQFLEKNWQTSPWYESGEFWFSMGIVGGILITVVSTYAIGQAAK